MMNDLQSMIVISQPGARLCLNVDDLRLLTQFRSNLLAAPEEPRARFRAPCNTHHRVQLQAAI